MRVVRSLLGVPLLAGAVLTVWAAAAGPRRVPEIASPASSRWDTCSST